MSKEKNFISAVIYVYNAEKRIGEFLEKIIDVLECNFEYTEIICVNDSSTDTSVEKIKEVCKKKASATNATVLNMSYYHGLETAMNAGVDLAIGDFVFEFDSTILDFDSTEIMNVYQKSLQGYDIVSALPDKKQRGTSNLFYFVFNRFTELKYNMHTERFRVLSRRVINRISSMNKTVPYRKVLYANCGLRTAYIQYKTLDFGSLLHEDKTERKYRASLAVDSLILFTDLGYSFAKVMAFIMIFASLFVTIYTIAIYFMGNPVAGWTTTILFLSVCFFGLFGILTFIIKYLQILVELMLKRKKYNFESIEKIT